MAYSDDGLNPGAENAKGGPFISAYTTTDTKATMEGAGYFNPAAEVLANSIRQGVIIGFDSNLNTTTMYGYQVSTADPPVVTLATGVVLD